MAQVSKKKLIGQPIFKQIVDLLPKTVFDLLVRKQKSEKYYKCFSSWMELITLLFGILSRCDSMGEVCDGMWALGGKLNDLGSEASPAKSTVGDGLGERDNELFKDFYFASIKHFEPPLSVSRIDGHNIKDVYIDPAPVLNYELVLTF